MRTKNIIKWGLLLVGVASLVSCKKDKEFDSFEGEVGSADYSKVVYVGNSLTAGFSDGALYYEGQVNSMPAIINEKLEVVTGPRAFNQPYMPKESVGFGSSLNARFGLTYSTNCKGETSLSPKPIATSGDVSILDPSNYIGDEGPYQNMGVPGARVFHLGLQSYGDPAGVATGTSNPFFARMASNPGNVSILEDAMAQNPSFFVLWIGNNDILGYATSGGEGAIGGTGSADITSPAVFSASYTGVLDALTSAGAKGVVATLPKVTSIPYFTTVPNNGLVISEEQATMLNTAYAQYNAGAQAFGFATMDFAAGANLFVVEDDDPKYDALGNIRQMTSDELLILTTPQDSLLCGGWGSEKPIPKEYVLDKAEIEAVENARQAFNSHIEMEAANRGLALVKVGDVLDNVSSGLVYDGIDLNATFVTGGAFSLDGIHLTQKGYAIMANSFISAMNEKYGSTIPTAEVNNYNGVLFP